MDEEQGVERFDEGLRALGLEAQGDGASGLWFAYKVENGPRAGETIELGFLVPPNFPLEPPHGPNYRPAILRHSGLAGVHPGRELGPDWDHWSRPHPSWAATDRSVRAWMRHIRGLNEELPSTEREEGGEGDIRREAA